MTRKDEYKTTKCSLTGNECDLGDCSNCDESSAHEHSERLREHYNLVPYDLTERKGIVFKTNYHRSIARFLTGTKIDTIITAFSLPDSTITPVPYNMSRLIVRWPLFVKMKFITSIGVPNKLVEVSNFLVAYYDDYIYVISPVLTDYEFENRQ